MKKSPLFSISSHSVGTFKTSGSKFTCYLFPARTRDEFEQELESIHSEHPAATHHCSAWRIGIQSVKEFSSDDGEPSGTAGLPILNTLRAENLTNCGAVVVRYYGGTQLGKPGLIQAYSRATKSATESAVKFRVIAVSLFRVEYEYDRQNLIDKWKHTYELIEKDSRYTATVRLTVACPATKSRDFSKELNRQQHLLIAHEALGETWEPVR